MFDATKESSYSLLYSKFIFLTNSILSLINEKMKSLSSLSRFETNWNALIFDLMAARTTSSWFLNLGFTY